MEIEISDDSQLHLQGSITIELPRYMTRVHENEMIEISKSSQRHNMIVACGKSADDLVLLTGDGRLMKLNLAQYKLPVENCLPIYRGRVVLFPDATTKDGYAYKAAAHTIIGLATPLNVHAGGEPTYQDNDKDSTQGTPKDNP